MTTYFKNLQGSLSETCKKEAKNTDGWGKGRGFMVNAVFSFNSSENLEMEKSSKKQTNKRTSLCILLARFMSAPQGDCPRPCSQL